MRMASTAAPQFVLCPHVGSGKFGIKGVCLASELQISDKETSHSPVTPLLVPAIIISKRELSAGHTLANTSPEMEAILLACPSRPSVIWPQPPAQPDSPLCFVHPVW